MSKKHVPAKNIYIFSCFEAGGLIQWSKRLIDTRMATVRQSINHMNEGYSQNHMLHMCRTLHCLLDASPFCIFYNLIWMTNKWVFVERAEYSVKMLMHHFMEIRHWAKRQQIYKHLFTFDVLPHIAAIATEPAKWRIYLRDMQTYYLTPHPPKHCGFSHSVCISVIRSIECTLQGW